ncbi:MAG: DUF2892 domain-containing protein [Coriobacteriia bacterium]|nr:DUF2892 domain-containing protein [Coriobacteriia bacterium]
MKVNESTTDRVIRAIVGVLAIAIGYLVFLGTTLAIILYVIGAILIFTAVTGFCLLYKLFGNFSTVKHTRRPRG